MERSESFPEIDRAEWFSLAAASEKILWGQLPFLIRLQELAATAKPTNPA